MYITTSKYQCI